MSIIPMKHAALPAIINAGAGFPALPQPVRLGIAKLLVAFPAGNQATSADEGAIRMEVYGEAIDGFPTVVVARVLKHLLFHNPRNPFAPTPQDVHEECERGYGAWRGAVVLYAGGGEWHTPSVYRAKHPKSSYLFDPSPPPWVDGCHLAPVTVKAILRSNSMWKESLTSIYGDFPPDEVFDRIPHDVFEPGEREKLLARRNEIKERDEQNRIRRLAKYGALGAE